VSNDPTRTPLTDLAERMHNDVMETMCQFGTPRPIPPPGWFEAMLHEAVRLAQPATVAAPPGDWVDARAEIASLRTRLAEAERVKAQRDALAETEELAAVRAQLAEADAILRAWHDHEQSVDEFKRLAAYLSRFPEPIGEAQR